MLPKEKNTWNITEKEESSRDCFWDPAVCFLLDQSVYLHCPQKCRFPTPLLYSFLLNQQDLTL